jgi:hypothetical protein
MAFRGVAPGYATRALSGRSARAGNRIRKPRNADPRVGGDPLGSPRISARQNLRELVNLQEVEGKAEP